MPFRVAISGREIVAASGKAVAWLERKLKESEGEFRSYRILGLDEQHFEGRAEREVVTALMALAQGDLDKLHKVWRRERVGLSNPALSQEAPTRAASTTLGGSYGPLSHNERTK